MSAGKGAETKRRKKQILRRETISRLLKFLASPLKCSHQRGDEHDKDEPSYNSSLDQKALVEIFGGIRTWTRRRAAWGLFFTHNLSPNLCINSYRQSRLGGVRYSDYRVGYSGAQQGTYGLANGTDKYCNRGESGGSEVGDPKKLFGQ